jgi:hypothetical protein
MRSSEKEKKTVRNIPLASLNDEVLEALRLVFCTIDPSNMPDFLDLDYSDNGCEISIGLIILRCEKRIGFNRAVKAVEMALNNLLKIAEQSCVACANITDTGKIAEVNFTIVH